MNTRKWGKISYPKGTSPVVVEVIADGYSSQIGSLGYRKESDLKKIEEALERKAKAELRKDQKADITIHFPKQRKKPVNLSVVGEQPITPPVIHYPSWQPPEDLIKDVKDEMAKNPNRKTASDLEAMAYLNTASLAAPLSEEWGRIYFYLTREYLESRGWKKFEGSMKFLDEYKSLSIHDQREMKSLKDWIFKQQQKILAERRKHAEKLEKETEK
ncbi:MAG: hypothetical protein QXF26_09225 [Candidatus Bathyarchaeia archaeon]